MSKPRAPRRTPAKKRGVVIEAGVRFLRSNPELLRYAQAQAPSLGMTIDQVLARTVEDLRAGEAMPRLRHG